MTSIARRRLGQTELMLTELGLGTAGLGNLYRPVDPEAAEATLEAAWTSGIRFFDTAPFYGFGLAERRLGDFLRGKSPGAAILATKVGRLLKPVAWDRIPDHGYVDTLPFAPEFDYSYAGVMRSVEDSYARLGLNRIDIAWVHDIGRYTHGDAHQHHMDALLSGGLRALQRLKEGGAIAAFGIGVNEVAVCLEVMERAPIDAILLAGRYSLLDRSAAARLLPLCAERGVSLVVGGVFNSGILATGAVPGARFDYAPAGADVIATVNALSAVAARHGVPLAAAALQFPLRDRTVASMLIGAASTAELTRNLQALSVAIPPAVWPEFVPLDLPS